MRFDGKCTEIFVVRFVHREAMVLTEEDFVFWRLSTVKAWTKKYRDCI